MIQPVSFEPVGVVPHTESRETSAMERAQDEDAQRSELETERRFYQELIQKASDGIHVLDEQGNVVCCSFSFAELLGYSYEEALRLNVRDWDRHFPQDQLIPIIKKLMHEPDIFETKHMKKTGEVFDAQINARGIELDGRHYIYASTRDISDRLRLERELRTQMERAESAMRAKSLFLANMSHEIRTPLNGILSSANLLFDGATDPEQRELLEVIHSCGDSLMTIINDVLDFSKVEAGKMEFEERPFDLQSSIREVLELLEAKAQDAGASVSQAVDRGVPPWVKGDVTRFKQILFNLIGNAIKFTKDRVLVRVSKGGGDHGEHEIVVSVEDNGIGIAEDMQAKLFQSFSQADASTTRRSGGTGLGLAISKRLAEAMGGRITVQSEVAVGSTFFFSLCAEATEARPRAKRARLSDFSPRIGAENPLRILIAEDNSINQMVARRMLEKLGYRPDVVGNGWEAVEAAQRRDYDLIFMDQHMPGMDGLQATREIRRCLENEGQPRIIALTASVLEEDQDRCRAAGMEGFLTKPIQIEDLVRELRGARAPSSD